MKVVFMAIAILFVFATNSYSWVESIQVEPFRPAPGDSVTVTVRGTMPNSCWKVVGQHCYGAGGQEITIEIETYNYDGRPMEHCMMVLVPYEVVCKYRLPTSGPYTVTATEICDSLTPCAGGTITEVFDTRGPQKK